MERDCSATARLLDDGWQVLRFWESAVRKDLDGCVRMTLDTIDGGAKREPSSVLPAKRCAEFFAGIGLMRLGLEAQGWSVAYANDMDPRKHEMYRTHFEDAEERYHLGDIHKVSSTSIPNVALATASFPRNDLSLAGARKGAKGKQSSAFREFMRILRGMGARKPPIVLLENATGFLTSSKGRDFREALLALNRLGYEVDAFIVDAAHFVPQSRKRLFVVGILNRGRNATGATDAPSVHESDVRPKMLADFISRNQDIRWNVRELPALPKRRSKLPSFLEKLPDAEAPSGFGDVDCVSVIDWIAKYYLNPVVNEMIRGRPLTSAETSQ
jgi:DNA (cytosine-5)-methyltransferase 1